MDFGVPFFVAFVDPDRGIYSSVVPFNWVRLGMVFGGEPNLLVLMIVT